jgi:serine protease Do
MSHLLLRIGTVLALFITMSQAGAAPAVDPLRTAIDSAVVKVKPSLVRIHVVEAYYREGRELKFEASGSGVVIRPEGYVVTNHHVAGHAKQIKVVFADKREFQAELTGTDPLTDIAVLKIDAPEGTVFPVVEFGDSDAVRAGDQVLAMGSPLALSQSVTLGIVSNTEMILPAWMNRWGGLEQDGEDVGALVRWFGHDASIYGGNSGGPLVNLAGDIIGINEISLGLGGAIPGNLAKSVAESIISEGRVLRAWIGVDVQPRLKSDPAKRGVLVSGVIQGSPAEESGIKAGDLLLSLGGAEVDVQFAEQLPDFNLLVTELPLGQPVAALLERAGEAVAVSLTPTERMPLQPREIELKPWGLTARNISFMMAKERKRDSTDGVLITSVRPGGPVGDAKPSINADDIIVRVGDTPVRNIDELNAATAELTRDATAPVPVLTTYERKRQEFVTVVQVGIKDLEDPGLEVKKAWLPVDTQVLTRDIALLMEKPDLTGFRVTHVYEKSPATEAGLQVGDIIFAVDGEPMTASAPEHYEELDQWIRQYRVGSEAELDVLRDGEPTRITIELGAAPKVAREMKKFRDENFEFTVRDVTFQDRAQERWEEEQHGVYVEEVKSGGWAALGLLSVGDLILAIDGTPVRDVDMMKELMDAVTAQQPAVVVFKVMRGIHTRFIDLEPKWEAPIPEAS